MIAALRPLLLALIPTLALLAADAAPGLAVWDAGQGTIGTEPGARGVGVRPGMTLVVSPDGPARVVLPGTANGFLTVAAGSTVTLAERRVERSGTTTAELLVTITAGAVTVGGDLAPRFAAVRLRATASETVAAPGVGVAVEADRVAGDTVVAIDGPVGTGPLPGTANGWQAVAERVTLAARSVVVVDPQRGVGEPAPAPRRPQLAGPAAARPGLRAQVVALPTTPAADAWTLDQAARDLGLPDPVWWTAPPAQPGAPGASGAPAASAQPPAKAWSALIQVSSFYDSNPNGVASDLGGGAADGGLSLYGDARWTCWTGGAYALRVQAVGGLVRYRGVQRTDQAGLAHDSRDKDQRQIGVNTALVKQGQALDWSIGIGGIASADDLQARRIVRLTGDVGGQVDTGIYAVLNLAWAHSSIDPSGGGADYTTRVVTARPALTAVLPTAWSSTMELSMLYTDSHAAVATDDFYAVRPGVSVSSRLGSVDVGLIARGEFITYRALRAATETERARETVVQATATADWWATDWWSVGLFGNCLWFDSNQPLAAYAQTQVGARTTLHW